MTYSRLFPVLTLVILGLIFSHSAPADVISVKSAGLEQSEEGYLLNADFEFDLTSRLEQALNSGVSLTFVVEFELTRSRWYWFDEKTASERLQIKLSHNPLLRQYRLSTGTLHQNFSSLTDAMRTLSRVRSWLVMDRDRVRADTPYVASVRMRLDTAQLPKPFQLSALTNRDWNLSSEWKRQMFIATEEVGAK